MLEELKCVHCEQLFSPSRRGHLHCSSTCRKLSHKAKNRYKSEQKRAKRISEKLKKLANHSFGKYLVQQAKRAETVEIFQGHNIKSLNELAALRRRCTSASGYAKGELLGTYELSHIWPVLSKNRLGLLHPENLVIAPRDFNRKHGSKEPTEGYLGKSSDWEALEPAFAVAPNEAALSVLKKIRRYIGQDFDKWLSGFVLTQSQRQFIIKSLVKEGLNKLVLEQMSLRQLKACADEREVTFFSINQEPEIPLTIVCEELQRLKIFVGLTDALLLLDRIDNSLEGSTYKFSGNDLEKSEFVDALVQDALACIHGQPYKGTFKDQPYQGWFEEIKWGAPVVSEVTNQSEDKLDDIL
jgi:hypothetical protein